jgi:hypothetical protein
MFADKTELVVADLGGNGLLGNRKSATKSTAFIRPFEVDDVNTLYALHQISPVSKMADR